MQVNVTLSNTDAEELKEYATNKRLSLSAAMRSLAFGKNEPGEAKE